MALKVLQTYERVFDTVLERIISNEKTKRVPENILQRLENLIRYTVKPQTEIRGATVPQVYMTLLPDSSPEKLELACVLGLCWQMITASAGTIDDYYEKSERRYGKPTWTLLQSHADIVVNDVLILQNIGLEVLKIYFMKSDAYPKLFNILHEFSKDFVMGQYLEMLRKNDNPKKDGLMELKSFSLELYEIQANLLNGKAFEAPVKLACALANDKGLENTKWVSCVDSICYGLASLWTFMDDYKDTFVVKTISNELRCSDIKNGKITWLIIKALEICSEKQLSLLEKYYGNKSENPEHTKVVLTIFMELEVPKLCQLHQSSMIGQLREQIQEFDKSGHKLGKYFLRILELIISYDK